MRYTLKALAIMAVFVAAPAHAQIGLRVHAGALQSTFYGEGTEAVDDVEAMVGYGFGVGLLVPIGGSFGVQVDGSFVPKGATMKAEGFAVDFMLSYIEIAPLLRFGSANVYGLAGPSMAFMRECDVALPAPIGTMACDDADIESRDTDFGAMGGLGVEFAVGSLNVGAEALLGIGVLSVDESDEDELRNRTIAVRAHISSGRR